MSVRRLRELDQIKTDLVSTVSHELRTPMTSILGYTELLDTGAAGPLSTAQQRMIDRLGASSQRLLFLVEDLLTLRQAESGALRRVVVAGDVRDTVTRPTRCSRRC